jgi:hypothetical protein
MQTPIVFTVFNRPEVASRVFRAIAMARPAKLYVIADGARADRPGEFEKCLAARKVIDQIDWDCEVVKDFSDVNLGPKVRLSSGINRVFQREEAAIILEHDCLPHSSFFPFCEELLHKYRDDPRVMHICANNFLFDRISLRDSYCFSRMSHTWGFATWRRAWQLYDVEMKAWPEIRESPLLLETLMGDRVCAAYFTEVFDRTFTGEINTWDYQWLLTCWRYRGLAILPKNTLVSNIGFGEEALYCREADDPLANLAVRPMHFPLRHPSNVAPSREADRFFIEHIAVPERRVSAQGWRQWLRRCRKKIGFRAAVEKFVRA